MSGPRLLINKFFFLIIYFLLGYYGLKGLIINYYENEVIELDVNNADFTNQKKYSTINFKDVKLGRLVAYEFTDNNKVDLVYSLIPESIPEESIPLTQALIKIENVDSDCLDGDCEEKYISKFEGICYSVLDEMDTTYINEIKEYGISISKNAVLINISEKSREWYWNLLMCLGLLFGFIILKSFFIKANSITDWLNKVSHQDELKNRT
ncbi:hypothetical protein [Aureibacter tunicatorum]|uniref:Uncharacterized protein n=1 Tax=Aureibacter tunicatorum TaxID=866807 RepID=A0AAE3XTQ6_9BACT|nr:hypothetical protein [Aureibacter tunicatorum]MDR6241504.1 hypothetical protein [Aureibacter tunicatorum]BDD07038.1 hypothetical protein AUTU_45210 [Aureibacter tunicatorum]